MTETEIRQAQFLDLLYDNDRSNPEQIPDVSDLLGQQYQPEDDAIWRGALRDLRNRGLIDFAETYDGMGASITARGRADVEARRARRNDRATRNVAARNAVVRWLYAQPSHRAYDLRPMLTDPISLLEGAPLALEDLDAALLYLMGKGLVDAVEYAESEVVLRPTLTDKGVDCVEHFGGSVSNYVRRDEGGRGNTTVNFHREVSGNVAWQNQGGVTQTTNVGVSADQLGELIGALKQALPVLGLNDADVQRLQGQLDVAEGEVESGQPDAGVVRSVLRRVLDKIGETGSTMLGAVLTAYAKHLMLQAGVPLEPGQ